jgi:hypothetical protein
MCSAGPGSMVSYMNAITEWSRDDRVTGGVVVFLAGGIDGHG